MINYSIVTIIATESRSINFYDALYIQNKMENKNSPINVVFFEEKEKIPPDICSHDKNTIYEKKYGDNYSINTILLDPKDSTTYCISVCMNRQIFVHFIELVKNSFVSENYKYIIVCRPSLVAPLMNDIVNLGFVFMGHKDREAIRMSTDHILNKVNNSCDLNFQKKEPKQIKIIEEYRTVFSVEMDFMCPFTLFGFHILEKNVKEYETYTEISNIKNEFAMFGPYISLTPGDYRVGWLVSSENAYRNNAILFDVSINFSTVNSIKSTISGTAPQWIWLDFHVNDGNNENIEFRINPKTRDTSRLHKIALRSRARVH